MNQDYNYQRVTMEIAPKYKDREELTVAILKDKAGCFLWKRHSLDEMNNDLSVADLFMAIGGVPKTEILAIYPDLNSVAKDIVNKSIEILNKGGKINLENLLKP